MEGMNDTRYRRRSFCKNQRNSGARTYHPPHATLILLPLTGHFGVWVLRNKKKKQRNIYLCPLQRRRKERKVVAAMTNSGPFDQMLLIEGIMCVFLKRSLFLQSPAWTYRGGRLGRGR